MSTRQQLQEKKLIFILAYNSQQTTVLAAKYDKILLNREISSVSGNGWTLKLLSFAG